MKNQTILNQNQLKNNQAFFLKIGSNVTQSTNNNLINFSDIINARKSENKTVQLNDPTLPLKQNNKQKSETLVSDKKSSSTTIEQTKNQTNTVNPADNNKTSRTSVQNLKAITSESNQTSKLVTVLKDPLNVTISTIQDLIQNSGAEVYILKDQQFQNVTDYFKQLKNTSINTNDLNQYISQKALSGIQQNKVQLEQNTNNKNSEILTNKTSDQTVKLNIISENMTQTPLIKNNLTEQTQVSKKLSDNVLVQLIINEVNLPVSQVQDAIKPKDQTKTSNNQIVNESTESKKNTQSMSAQTILKQNSDSGTLTKNPISEKPVLDKNIQSTVTIISQNESITSIKTKDNEKTQSLTSSIPLMINQIPVNIFKAVDLPKNNQMFSQFKKSESLSEKAQNYGVESKNENLQKPDAQTKLTSNHVLTESIIKTKDNNVIQGKKENTLSNISEEKVTKESPIIPESKEKNFTQSVNTQVNLSTKTENNKNINTDLPLKDHSHSTSNVQRSQIPKNENVLGQSKVNHELRNNQIPLQKQAEQTITPTINNNVAQKVEVKAQTEIPVSKNNDQVVESVPLTQPRINKTEPMTLNQSKIDSKPIVKDQNILIDNQVSHSSKQIITETTTNKTNETMNEAGIQKSQIKESAPNLGSAPQTRQIITDIKQQATITEMPAQKLESSPNVANNPQGKVIAKFSQSQAPAQLSHVQNNNYQVTQKDAEQITQMNEKVQVSFSNKPVINESHHNIAPQIQQNAQYQSARLNENKTVSNVMTQSEVKTQPKVSELTHEKVSVEAKFIGNESPKSDKVNPPITESKSNFIQQESKPVSSSISNVQVESKRTQESNNSLRNSEKPIISQNNPTSDVQNSGSEKISQRVEVSNKQNYTPLNHLMSKPKPLDQPQQEIRFEHTKANNVMPKQNTDTLNLRPQDQAAPIIMTKAQESDNTAKAINSESKITDKIKFETVKTDTKIVDVNPPQSLKTGITDTAVNVLKSNTKALPPDKGNTLLTATTQIKSDKPIQLNTAEKTELAQPVLKAIKREETPIQINRISIKNNTQIETQSNPETPIQNKNNISANEMKTIRTETQNLQNTAKPDMSQTPKVNIIANENIKVIQGGDQPEKVKQPVTDNSNQSTVKHEVKNINVRENIEILQRPLDKQSDMGIAIKSEPQTLKKESFESIKPNTVTITDRAPLKEKLSSESVLTVNETVKDSPKVSIENKTQISNQKVLTPTVREIKTELNSKQENTITSHQKYDSQDSQSVKVQPNESLPKNVFKTTDSVSMQKISSILHQENKIETLIPQIQLTRPKQQDQTTNQKSLSDLQANVQQLKTPTYESKVAQIIDKPINTNATLETPKNTIPRIETNMTISKDTLSLNEAKMPVFETQQTKVEKFDAIIQEQVITKPVIANQISEKSTLVSSENQVKISSQNNEYSEVTTNKSTYDQSTPMAHGLLNNNINRQNNQQFNEMKRYEDMNLLDQNNLKPNQNDVQINMLKQHIDEKQPFIVKFMGGDGQEKIQSFVLDREKPTQTQESIDNNKKSEVKELLNSARKVSNNTQQDNTQSNDQSNQGNQQFNFFNQTANISFNRTAFAEKAKATSQEFLLKINDTISQLKNNAKSNFASFEVEVEQVGNVKTSVEKKGEEIIVRFIAESNQSAMTLKDQLTHLESQLKEFGFMNVNIEYHFNNQNDSQYSQSQQHRSRKGNINFNNSETSVETVENNSQIKDMGYNSMEYII